MTISEIRSEILYKFTRHVFALPVVVVKFDAVIFGEIETFISPFTFTSPTSLICNDLLFLLVWLDGEPLLLHAELFGSPTSAVLDKPQRLIP